MSRVFTLTVAVNFMAAGASTVVGILTAAIALSAAVFRLYLRMAQFRDYASRLQMIYIVYAHISSGRTVALRCGAAATPLRHFFATESSTEPQSDFLVMCRAGGLSLMTRLVSEGFTTREYLFGNPVYRLTELGRHLIKDLSGNVPWSAMRHESLG